MNDKHTDEQTPAEVETAAENATPADNADPNRLYIK